MKLLLINLVFKLLIGLCSHAILIFLASAFPGVADHWLVQLYIHRDEFLYICM
jgi:hypothetical protein